MRGQTEFCCGFAALPLCAFALILAVLASTPKPSAALELKCYPPSIQLNSAKARQQLVVQATAADGVTRDATGQANGNVANAALARLVGTTLTPVADGSTELRVTFEGCTVSVPLVISNSAARPPVSFRHDVLPVFTKAGCNAGSCHGTSRGKDGFHLSLYGFDPDGDYFRLTSEQIGRRVNLAIPEESLIVQKGLGAVQHTGGMRFGTNSELCQTLIAWLTAGGSNDPPVIPKLTGIEIFPKSAVLEGSNTVQYFIV